MRRIAVGHHWMSSMLMIAMFAGLPAVPAEVNAEEQGGTETTATAAEASTTTTETGTTTTDARDELGLQPVLLVQLAVADLDRSIAFYQDVLGFELESRTDAIQWARMKLGIAGVTIGLGVQPEPKGSGTVSLNLGVGNLERARATLEARGVTFDGPTIHIPGVVSLADFHDPDGNKLRLAGPHD